MFIVKYFLMNLIKWISFAGLFLVFSCQRTVIDQSVMVQLYPRNYTDEMKIDGTVEAVNSITLLCPQRIDGTIIYLVEDGTMVKEGDTVCIIENRELTNRYETLMANVEKIKANYNKSIADLDMNYAMLEAQLNNINAQTSIANLDSFQLHYVSPVQRQIKELELQIASIEKGKYERRLEFLKRINESELKKIQLQIKREENQAARVKEILDAMVLTAPLTGLALRANSRMNNENKIQEGDQVWDNVPIVSIPDMRLMKVIIQAPETDYRRISLNDSVFYTFDAMPGNHAWGRIQKIAPMGRSLSRNANIKVFEVTASIDSFLTNPEPGMSAQCNIVMKQIPDTIVVPQLAIFEEDSIRVVYVSRGKHFTRAEVVTGISSPRDALIAAGLQGNELLSYVKPPSHMVLDFVPVPDSVKQYINSLNADTTNVYMSGMEATDGNEPYFEIIILN